MTTATKRKTKAKVISHTPGPWTPHTDVVGNNPDICVDASGYGIIADIPGGSLETRQANALLIAAAPDLLAACESIVTWYEAIRDDMGHKISTTKADHAIKATALIAMNKVQYAIAKAKSKS